MSKKKIALPIVLLGGACIAGYFVYQSMMYVHSDNAQVEARVLMIASKVSGFIREVNADIGDQVKAGDILARLDDREYSNSLERAKADLESINVRLQDAQKNYSRWSALYSKGAATQAQMDTAATALNELKARDHSTKSQLAQAQLDVESTVIKAPFDGVVAKRGIEVGQFVTMAAPLFGYVDSTARWITANLKETEIDSIKMGAAVDIKIDAIDGKVFSGSVLQVSPTTGSTFTMIPPDNATGNFTKVVQRIPIRIAITGTSADDLKVLRAGLSADIKVHRR